MRILAIEKENLGLSSEAFAPFLTQEAARVWELTQEGIIREIYFRDDQTSAVLILECEDVAEAVKQLNTLPLVRQKLITFEIIPLRPYPGLARLFGQK